jgi:type II secretory pathway predicted ATPase ExeA
MSDSPFDHISESAQHFTTPQLEDVFQSVLTEIQNLRPLSCVIGFPKSGKTYFLKRLKSALQTDAISLVASSEYTLSHALMTHSSGEDENKPILSRLLREKRSLLLLVDNAHLLTDGDFAFLASIYTLAEKQRTLMQAVLVGNGEIVHRLARPENRGIYTKLGAIWSLPKLTREESLAYIRHLLDQASLAGELITNPDAMAKQAGGVIGILRMLTITMALKALHARESCDAEAALESGGHEEKAPKAGPSADMPTQKMTSHRTPWAGGILALTMAGLIALFLVFFSWLMPGGGVGNFFSLWKNAPQGAAVEVPAPAPQPLQGVTPGSGAIQMMPVAKTVFRKRTKDGPYSLQLGAYPTVESLLLHLPRFAEQPKPLFWNRDLGENPRFSLFLGRFDSFEEAGKFAADKSLQNTQVVFRPFVATIGPLTDPQQIRMASMAMGLPQHQQIFEQELVSGVEVQFALERSREDALAHCAKAEKKGLSCAVTQYE